MVNLYQRGHSQRKHFTGHHLYFSFNIEYLFYVIQSRNMIFAMSLGAAKSSFLYVLTYLCPPSS